MWLSSLLGTRHREHARVGVTKLIQAILGDPTPLRRCCCSPFAVGRLPLYPSIWATGGGGADRPITKRLSLLCHAIGLRRVGGGQEIVAWNPMLAPNFALVSR